MNKEYPGSLSFASFYSRNILPKVEKDVCVLLPLILESINFHAVVAHTMKQVARITERVNPCQHSVITADQPVYALCKQVQLMITTYKTFFCKMGDLHTEMAFLSANGDLLEGSGWTEVYGKSNISTQGRVDSFLKGSKVKRTRYAYQLSLKVLLQHCILLVHCYRHDNHIFHVCSQCQRIQFLVVRWNYSYYDAMVLRSWPY